LTQAPVVAFGGAYDRDENRVITGEHYTWDCTKYSAPTFEGRRNLLINSSVGTKADDFDGTNETQRVAGVQDKFTEYQSNANVYTNGYGPDSYTRQLLLNWNDKRFVRSVCGVGSCRRKGD
jgi:hypothetical protein